ncbi:MAG: hypothetical protein FWD94_00060 [Treponema sp.]|nr:hypothetical protein [Treponema sp.]
MRKNRVFGVLVVLGLGCSALLSCGTSTESLAKQVQEGIFQRYTSNNPWGLKFEVKEELRLVKKSKTEYTGLMTIGQGTGLKDIRLSVEVLFDGKNIQYEWVER